MDGSINLEKIPTGSNTPASNYADTDGAKSWTIIRTGQFEY
jgi:hypothetical protein